MPTHPLTAKYPVGKTARITVHTVRETEVAYNTNSPDKLYRYWREVVATQPDYEADKESVVVVMITSRMRPYAWNRVSLGSLTEVIAYPREIMRPVLIAGAYAFAMMHNHPSGDPSPSLADEAITRRIRQIGEMLDVRLVDHMIIGEPEPGRTPYFSFREAGLIP